MRNSEPVSALLVVHIEEALDSTMWRTQRYSQLDGKCVQLAQDTVNWIEVCSAGSAYSQLNGKYIELAQDTVNWMGSIFIWLRIQSTGWEVYSSGSGYSQLDGKYVQLAQDTVN